MPVNFGAALVALGEADGAVAGAVAPTRDVIRAALWAIGTAPGVRLVSSAFYMVLPDDQVLTFTDCAVVPEPTPEQLASIALAAARDRPRLVGDSAAGRLPVLQHQGQRRGPAGGASAGGRGPVPGARAPDSSREGEVQADARSGPRGGERKAPGVGAGRRANVLVFPDLDAGNIAYKLVQRLAGAAAIGPMLQGLARPMADLSRGATADDIVEVAAMVALQGSPDELRERRDGVQPDPATQRGDRGARWKARWSSATGRSSRTWCRPRWTRVSAGS